jgi:hypothetical protein
MGTGSGRERLELDEMLLDIVRSHIWLNIALFSSMVVRVVEDCLLENYPRAGVEPFCCFKEFRYCATDGA